MRSTVSETALSLPHREGPLGSVEEVLVGISESQVIGNLLEEAGVHPALDFADESFIGSGEIIAPNFFERAGEGAVLTAVGGCFDSPGMRPGG